MSYFPDWRSEKNYKHLSHEDRAYLQGYRAAYEDALSFFANMDVAINISDTVKFVIEAGSEQMDAIKDLFNDWMDCQELENTVSIFDGADYLPEDLELEDNKPYMGANDDTV